LSSPTVKGCGLKGECHVGDDSAEGISARVRGRF
jgi:hypothetical protein